MGSIPATTSTMAFLCSVNCAVRPRLRTRISGRGLHTGEVMGAAPTGKKLTWSALVLSRFVDGKIAEEWVGDVDARLGGKHRKNERGFPSRPIREFRDR